MAFKPTFITSDQQILLSLHYAGLEAAQSKLQDGIVLMNSGCPEYDKSKVKKLLDAIVGKAPNDIVFKNKKGLYEIGVAVEFKKIKEKDDKFDLNIDLKILKDKTKLEAFKKANLKIIDSYMKQIVHPILEAYCTKFGGSNFYNSIKSKLDKAPLIPLSSFNGATTIDNYVIGEEKDLKATASCILLKFAYLIVGKQ